MLSIFPDAAFVGATSESLIRCFSLTVSNPRFHSGSKLTRGSRAERERERERERGSGRGGLSRASCEMQFAVGRETQFTRLVKDTYLP